MECKRFRLFLHITSWRGLSSVCRLSHSFPLLKVFYEFGCHLTGRPTLVESDDILC